jgi:hypothetical protein
MVVHHVEMNDVGPRVEDIDTFLTQAGEVRRQDGRGDQVISHDPDLSITFCATMMPRRRGSLPDSVETFSLVPQ